MPCPGPPYALPTVRNSRQETARSVLFVPGMRFLVCDFGTACHAPYRRRPRAALTQGGHEDGHELSGAHVIRSAPKSKTRNSSLRTKRARTAVSCMGLRASTASSCSTTSSAVPRTAHHTARIAHRVSRIARHARQQYCVYALCGYAAMRLCGYAAIRGTDMAYAAATRPGAT
eukprot:1617341-Rhodomonas_salina.2